MTTTIGDWTNSVIIAPSTVAIGEGPIDGFIASLDLTAKLGAWLYARIARVASSGTVVEPLLHVRRNDGVQFQAKSPFDRVGLASTALVDTTVSSSSTTGAFFIDVTDTAGFAKDDIVAIFNPTGPANFEVLRVAKVDAGTPGTLTFDQATIADHASGQTVINETDVWSMWLPPGAIYTVGFDYETAASGSSLIVQANANVHNNLTTT